MRAFSLVSLSLLIGLLAACAGQPTLQFGPTAIPSTEILPTPASTATPTFAPQPRQSTTETPTAVAEPCLLLLKSYTSEAGLLRVVYATDCVNVFFGSPIFPTKLWLWKEESRSAEPFPLPQDAIDPRPSTDNQLILFRRVISSMESELWLIDSDGRNERRIATIEFNEARVIDPTYVWLQYDWIHTSHKVFYSIRYNTYGVGGEPAYDQVVVADADTSQVHSLVPPDEVYELAWAPEGNQVAALKSEELLMIDTHGGRVQFAIPLEMPIVYHGTLSYSPDGKQLVVHTSGGMTVINTSDGTLRKMPLEYQLFGEGDSPCCLPPLAWLDETALYALIPNLPDGMISFDPRATFTVWLIDLDQLQSTPLSTFTGYLPQVSWISPDKTHLVYYRIPDLAGLVQEMYLGDILSGEYERYGPESRGGHIFWAPDSRRFLFQPDEQLYLGQMGDESTPLGLVAYYPSIRWVDTERFLANGGPGPGELLLYSLKGEGISLATGR